MNSKIAIPYIGKYYIPISYVLKKITKTEIAVLKENTIRCLNLKEFPTPLIDHLNNYISALKQGATILVQLDSSIYTDLEAEILEQLGYTFYFADFIDNNHFSLLKTYKFAKSINNKLNIFSYLYYIIQGLLMIGFIDKFENYQRINYAKANNKEMMTNLHKTMLRAYQRDKLSIYKIITIYHKCYQKAKLVPLKDETSIVKILIVGDPYISISNQNIDNYLLSQNAIIYRKNDLTHQLFNINHINTRVSYISRKYIKHASEYATNIVYQVLTAIQNGIDGLIYIYSNHNSKELNAMSIIKEISYDYNFSSLFLTCDNSANSKIKKFYDKLKYRKSNYF